MTSEELKAARMKLGLTQAGLATALGFADAHHVRRLEKGKRGVSGPVAVAVELMLKGGRPSTWPKGK